MENEENKAVQDLRRRIDECQTSMDFYKIEIEKSKKRIDEKRKEKEVLIENIDFLINAESKDIENCREEIRKAQEDAKMYEDAISKIISPAAYTTEEIEEELAKRYRVRS
ncbi:MAG: hypothetical protein WC346_15170 [Methanogenium sp.]|jgi:uncharacterized coiled-coil DUF342 family protein